MSGDKKGGKESIIMEERRLDMSSNPRISEKLVETNDELELRGRGFLLGKTLGEGSYAKVKAAFDQNRKQKCALKIVNRRKAPKEFQNKFLPRELAVLKKVKHENVVLLHEIIVYGDKIVMVMELAGHGDLLEYIKLRGALDERRSRKMFGQVVSAIDYLHQRNIVHRDLKCENILLDKVNNVKVSDFGFCKELIRGGAPSCTFCGSSAYASPEILQGKPYCAMAADVWSLGVILYIMACGKMPFDDSSIKRLIKDQLAKRLIFPSPPQSALSYQLTSLIRWMLQPLVSKRATIADVKHSFWLVLGQIEANKEENANAGTRAQEWPSTATSAKVITVSPAAEEKPKPTQGVTASQKKASQTDETSKKTPLSSTTTAIPQTSTMTPAIATTSKTTPVPVNKSAKMRTGTTPLTSSPLTTSSTTTASTRSPKTGGEGEKLRVPTANASSTAGSPRILKTFGLGKAREASVKH